MYHLLKSIGAFAEVGFANIELQHQFDSGAEFQGSLLL